MGVMVPRGGRAIRVGLVGLAVALGLVLARPPAAGAFSFECVFGFPGPGFPGTTPGMSLRATGTPPNGLNPCSGSVSDTAPSIPGNSAGDIWFDAFMPPLSLTPTDTFTTAPNYGAGVTVTKNPSQFPASAMPGETVEPGKVIYRMNFHVVNSNAGATGEPPVAYTINFNLPARLAIAPGTIGGLSSPVGQGTSQPYTVTNVSNDTSVQVTGVALGGAGAAAYQASGCLNVTLPPHGSCTVTLTFTPGSAGSFAVNLTVTGNEGSTARVSGAGTGTTTSSTGGGSGGSSGGSGGNQAPPCDCAKVTGFVNDFGVYHPSSRLTFKLHTAIACTPGSGAGCSGKASLLAPKGMFFVTPPVKGAKKPVRKTTMSVACSGKCGRTTTASASFALLAINLKNHRLSPKGRGAGPPYKLVLQTNCISPTGVLRPPTRLTLKIAFKKNGNVDYKKSDLNGDGKPDGRQLK
jgi:hypothetical protein